ncbi:MAG TPA: hypothetical protein VKW78_13465 [Terriglobales bacterium]|nr:hypothetical protein [Terriglobales bacterium]
MLHHIRPYKLFTSLNGNSNNLVRLPIPKRRGIGGLSLLETFSVIAAVKLVKAERLLRSEHTWALPR